MKLLLLLCLLSAGEIYSEEESIFEIRKYYQWVQKNLNTFNQIKIDYTHKNSKTDETDLLEEQIYFYEKNGRIIRVVGDMVYDCSGKVNELTYKNKKLIFIYSYEWSGCNRDGISGQHRYYFKNEKLFRWMEGEEAHPKSALQLKEKELLKLSTFYLKQAPKN